ncbi:hypothetical protein [Thiothrix nivea]|uniref:Uncharacterized protein n=1 Tax=Thiothrix nivea (strain ATCC 35100 / DSM 5205 / JP2) TaxID=870187 RepID=A0A656HNP5_THINJ|nr:hypothetical protein [Thiothrix nivea]EIJ36969.1 hypothetical protein Thini_4495 [Thiothrix nivea DSM 5205]
MSLGQNQNSDLLIKQYEQAWQQVRHLDSSYIQITLLYMALIGAYIGSFDKLTTNLTIVSIGISAVSLCITGIIFRTRYLIDKQMEIILKIEESLEMMPSYSVSGLKNIRTSSYLILAIIFMTTIAIILGLK